ncbi:MAG: 30S ribosomal protein S12 methylthiotransferase RimO [Lachnospiraceae bacterium]|nr:30S ribosomal protein S12 methylthiotransferase RimO [Lachnospiraceae bacterium]
MKQNNNAIKATFEDSKSPLIMLISLGCDKNLVDSEMMLGMLSEAGYRITDIEEEADVIIVNTCCFIGDAKEESINTILEVAELKKSGKLKGIVVCGCLSERYKEDIIKEIPEVDAIVGTSSFDDIVEATKHCLEKSGCHSFYKDISAPCITEKKRLVSTGGHYAHLKIAEGCGKNCTYCIIPKIRGNYRSVPIESLIKEARELISQGVKELILVAQETTLYGTDLYGKKSLSRLLRELCAIDGLEWIRIQYCYPEEIDDELIATIKEEDKVCNYLDLPIQHCNDSILKRMGRRTDKADIERIVAKLRKEIPDICLRTTLITGFPGETEEDFEELYRFVNETEFDRLGVFSYSAEENTPAATMENQIPDEVKDSRRDEIMELQQAVSYDLSEKRVGRVYRTFIEGRDTKEDVYVGRTYMDAPGVDGYVFIKTDQNLMSGDFIDVKITDFNEYDLIGEPVNV